LAEGLKTVRRAERSDSRRESIETVRLLLIEDDRRLADLLLARFRREGHEAAPCHSGTEGLDLASSGRFDLAVVDVMLPGMDGVALTSKLRADGSRMPVLMLTARDTVDDRVTGLRSGADDYLVKPFAFDELLARIDALARRTDSRKRISHRAVELDAHARKVRVNGHAVELTAKEFDLLECLLRNAGRVMTRTELKEHVWDFGFDAQTKVVDLYVHYLRKKLGDGGDIIQTVRGVGYAVGR
jgi:two-component system OmpR family response regulator